MKKNKNELIRLQNLIENDRISTGDNFLDLVKSDSEKLYKDYFEMTKNPEIVISKNKDGYKITVSFSASRIKSFACIPD